MPSIFINTVCSLKRFFLRCILIEDYSLEPVCSTKSSIQKSCPDASGPPGVLSVDSAGEEATEEVYDDMNPDQIESLPLTQMHRPVDVAIVEADKEGYVKTYIILPSTIYGLAKTRFVDAGVQNPHSIQLPSLIGASIERGQGGMIGKGKNLWPNVEVHERE